MRKMIYICILLIYFKVISKKGGHYCPRLPYIICVHRKKMTLPGFARDARLNIQTEIVNGERIVYFQSVDDDFTIIELQTSLKHLKNGKAAGLDEILTEEIKNFGPVTTQWVLNLLNACARTHRLPRLWRQARVVALLKPGKDPSSPKSFRPNSLLCHLYKL